MGRLTAQPIDGWRRSALSRHPQFIRLQYVATRAEVPNPAPPSTHSRRWHAREAPVMRTMAASLRQ